MVENKCCASSIKTTGRTYHTEASPGPMKASKVLVAEDKEAMFSSLTKHSVFTP
jgi:hypothetical protein